MIEISKRKYRRFQRAEQVARATRLALAHPTAAGPDDWAVVASALLSWIRLAGKEAFLPVSPMIKPKE